MTQGRPAGWQPTQPYRNPPGLPSESAQSHSRRSRPTRPGTPGSNYRPSDLRQRAIGLPSQPGPRLRDPSPEDSGHDAKRRRVGNGSLVPNADPPNAAAQRPAGASQTPRPSATSQSQRDLEEAARKLSVGGAESATNAAAAEKLTADDFLEFLVGDDFQLPSPQAIAKLSKDKKEKLSDRVNMMQEKNGGMLSFLLSKAFTLPDEQVMEALPKQSKQLVASRINKIQARNANNMRRKRFKHGSWREYQSLQRRKELRKPGTLFSGVVVEKQYDNGLGPGTEGRMDCDLVTALAEIRMMQVLKKSAYHPFRVQVSYCTSFKDSEFPPGYKRNQCYRLVNEEDGLPKYDAVKDEMNVAFRGRRELSKKTFVEFQEKHWFDLRSGPLKWEGELSAGSFGQVAGINDLRSNHPYWAEADKRMKRKAGESERLEREARRPKGNEAKERFETIGSGDAQDEDVDKRKSLPKVVGTTEPTDAQGDNVDKRKSLPKVVETTPSGLTNRDDTDQPKTLARADTAKKVASDGDDANSLPTPPNEDEGPGDGDDATSLPTPPNEEESPAGEDDDEWWDEDGSEDGELVMRDMPKSKKA